MICDTQMQVESLHLKLAALNDDIFNRLRSVQKREAGVTGHCSCTAILA